MVGLSDKEACRKVATAMMRLASDGGPVSESDFVELIKNIVVGPLTTGE